MSSYDIKLIFFCTWPWLCFRSQKAHIYFQHCAPMHIMTMDIFNKESPVWFNVVFKASLCCCCFLKWSGYCGMIWNKNGIQTGVNVPVKERFIETILIRISMCPSQCLWWNLFKIRRAVREPCLTATQQKNTDLYCIIPGQSSAVSWMDNITKKELVR